MQFSLREAMWWFAIAATMAAALFSTPSPTSVLTSMTVFGVPLVLISVYVWVKSDADGRRWIKWVTKYASIAVLIALPLRRTSLFEPLLFAPVSLSRPWEVVAYGIGCIWFVVGLLMFVAALAGASKLVSRTWLGWLLLGLLVVWVCGWVSEFGRTLSTQFFIESPDRFW